MKRDIRYVAVMIPPSLLLRPPQLALKCSSTVAGTITENSREQRTVIWADFPTDAI